MVNLHQLTPHIMPNGDRIAIIDSVTSFHPIYMSWHWGAVLCAVAYCAHDPWSGVTESMVTIRSPFCEYNTTWCVQLNGEDLSRYSNKIELVSLRKCPYDHWLTNEAYLSAITVTNIYQSLPTRWRQKSTGIDMEQNDVTVTLCIASLGVIVVHFVCRERVFILSDVSCTVRGRI